jgi:hypothetical protein
MLLIFKGFGAPDGNVTSLSDQSLAGSVRQWIPRPFSLGAANHPAGRERMRKPTRRARRYLECVPDWSADWEIVERLNDGTERLAVRAMLGRLIGYGFVNWSRSNDTYRISDIGRAALTEGEAHDAR